MGTVHAWQISHSHKSPEQKIRELSDLIGAHPENHSFYYYRGLAYQDHEDFDEALKDFEKVVELHPSSQREIGSARAKLYCAWGKKLIRSRDYVEALRKFRLAHQLNSQDSDLCYHQGLCYEEIHCTAEAELFYTSAVRLRSWDATYYFRRAVVRQRLGRGAEAVLDADQVIAHLFEETEEIHRGVAEIYDENQEYEKAIQEYTKILRFSVNDEKVYFQKAMAYFHLGKDSEAIENFNQAFILGHLIQPYAARAHLRRAKRLSCSQEYLPACSDYNEYLFVFPDDYLTHYERGINYFNVAMNQTQLKSHYYALALQDFRSVCERASVSLQIARDLKEKMAYIYELQGLEAFEDQKYLESITKLDELLQYSNQKAQRQRAQFYRSLAHYHLRNYTEAIAGFSTFPSGFLNSREWLSASYFERSQVFVQEGKYEEALKDCQEYLSRNPGNAEVYLTQGLAYEGLGALEDARCAVEHALRGHADSAKTILVRILKKMISLVPDVQEKILLCTDCLDLEGSSPEIYEARANAYLNLEQYNAAIQDFEKGEQASAARLQAYFCRAEIKLAESHYSEAIADFQEYLQFKDDPSLTPETQKAYYYLGVAYEQMSQYERALEALEQALVLNPRDSLAEEALTRVKSISRGPGFH